jgi:uncharacterized damage-inducible protein DinB
MPLIAQLRRLFDHASWADGRLLETLAALGAGVPAPALREYAHILGSEETWLSRLDGRAARLPVWPDLPPDALPPVVREIQSGYDRYLAAIDEARLNAPITYTNSAGQTFTNTVSDILLHVALHAQYHRGKVNLLLRQAQQSPVPADFIAYARGVPAAVTSLRGAGPR